MQHPLYNQISLSSSFCEFCNSGICCWIIASCRVIPVIDNGGIQKFVNTYKAEKAKTRLGVKKTLTGRELKADEFEFTDRIKVAMLKKLLRMTKKEMLSSQN